MTKFVLAGGEDFRRPDYGRRLGDELRKTLNEIKVLSCFFTYPREEWQRGAEHWESWFRDNVGDIASYDYATPENLAEKSKSADVLYFHGGDTRLLLETVRKIKDFKEILKGKIVVGSSAGAMMIAEDFWHVIEQKPGKGLGLLPVNVIVHYGAANFKDKEWSEQDWKDTESAFQKYLGPDKDILKLPEGEFKIFEVDD